MSSLSVAGPRPVLADLVPGALVRDTILVAGGAALTGAAAQILIPVPGSPVPMTGQTFAALLVGAALGWKRGALSMALYLAVGAAGFGWFQNGSSGLFGASAGYIVGFVFAGALVGALAGRGGDRTPLRMAGTMVLGNLVIYSVGVPWLMASTGFGLSTALAKGVVPFLIGDALKIAVAAALLPGTWALVSRFRKES
ncbi:biotin transporter BioY [Amycolatopsis sp. WAC 01375]|uniref:biotin transporter BioY n=1 Tax=unclassified Amycolatopsis TaxID=2618356 RepID=UPI000F7A3707|nr:MULTISPECIES: biotin transporter BioY [unclassified Amycolatopsis]RSM78788.1 biotin transporter BioY [Amycolatopsis sp. WAC 01375]RSN32318.1 biotin transporter BioY [Amycolatopsis sp. WAC 01416]